ncbi:HK97 family phage prohead protease [Herbaspirillum sp. 1130]|uniref:HK97 family phage prohead protease n=1 Tax=Herbaspirillum sp. 1130 TaxID=2806562 RepID=UPI001AE78460|nr:HK97 family phage prohead protease [Herbaspirillum sp. 1130]MBP1316306.1 HK97 family phage prohead protease [Herbaspirillum sp. 1130]
METKVLKLELSEFKLDDNGKTFQGYASTFGNVDSYGDTIVKGAYAETLKQYGLPKMFFNHNTYEVPMGKWVDAAEDDHGLKLAGEFTPGNTLADQVRAAIKHGTLDGLSIGYRLKKGDFDITETGRTIRKVARLPEVSIVTFPADGKALLDRASVKSNLDGLDEVETIRDLEYFLRDAGGFSKQAAQAVVAKFKTLTEVRDAPTDAKAEMLRRLEAMAAP